MGSPTPKFISETTPRGPKKSAAHKSIFALVVCCVLVGGCVLWLLCVCLVVRLCVCLFEFAFVYFGGR